MECGQLSDSGETARGGAGSTAGSRGSIRYKRADSAGGGQHGGEEGHANKQDALNREAEDKGSGGGSAAVPALGGYQAGVVSPSEEVAIARGAGQGAGPKKWVLRSTSA